jgi:N-acylglucosamine 2-epimerase (GlcNAc 2-epimerase)
VPWRVNDLALKVARDAFDWLEAHAHDAGRGGYFEALKRDRIPIITWDESLPTARRQNCLGVYDGFKTMNSHIHLLEALAELSRVDCRPIVTARLREVFQLVRDMIAVEPGALNLYLTHDWRAIPAHDSFGHDIETAYLLVEAADALGMADDEPIWTIARRLVDHALDLGLGRRERRVLRQGRFLRGPSVRHHQGLVDPGRGTQRAAGHGQLVRRQDGQVRQSLPEAMGLHPGAYHRPCPRRLVPGNPARWDAAWRRCQGQSLEGQLSHVAGDDERGEPLDDAGP